MSGRLFSAAISLTTCGHNSDIGSEEGEDTPSEHAHVRRFLDCESSSAAEAKRNDAETWRGGVAHAPPR